MALLLFVFMRQALRSTAFNGATAKMDQPSKQPDSFCSVAATS
jgi:hypothetical protein